MATKRRIGVRDTSHSDLQDRILIQRLTTIATIELSQQGIMPPVEAAFSAAGTYLDGRAGRDGESDEVQFEFMGVTFRASCEVTEPEHHGNPTAHGFEDED